MYQLTLLSEVLDTIINHPPHSWQTVYLPMSDKVLDHFKIALNTSHHEGRFVEFIQLVNLVAFFEGRLHWFTIVIFDDLVNVDESWVCKCMKDFVYYFILYEKGLKDTQKIYQK